MWDRVDQSQCTNFRLTYVHVLCQKYILRLFPRWMVVSTGWELRNFNFYRGIWVFLDLFIKNFFFQSLRRHEGTTPMNTLSTIKVTFFWRKKKYVLNFLTKFNVIEIIIYKSFLNFCTCLSSPVQIWSVYFKKCLRCEEIKTEFSIF